MIYTEPDDAIARADLEKLRPLKLKEDPFADLVISRETRDILLGSVGSFFGRTDAATDQSVEIASAPDNQTGLNILLHGAPGSGKSMTAQCLADYVKRPLLPLSSGRIGGTAEQMEKDLTETFQLAQEWDCIMLIDDADLYLAERERSDILRNSIVTGTLLIGSHVPTESHETNIDVVLSRALENYQGRF